MAGTSDSKASNLTFKPILLDGPDEKQSAAAAELAALLVKPAIFDNLDVIVPKYALNDIEGGKEPETPECCKAWTRFVYKFFQFLTIICLPIAILFKEILRCYGFALYYFLVVPSRNVNYFFCNPVLDSVYRLLNPVLTFCVVLVRPATAIIRDAAAAIGEFFKTACNTKK